MKSESTYLNNELNGEKKEYYLSKNIKTKGIYKNGKKEGKWYLYDEKGAILEIAKYKNGIKK